VASTCSTRDNSFSVVNAVPGKYVMSTVQDRNKNYWVGTLARPRPAQSRLKTVKHFAYDPADSDGLSDNAVTAVIWIRWRYMGRYSSEGLNHYDPLQKDFTHYRHDSSRPAALPAIVSRQSLRQQRPYLDRHLQHGGGTCWTKQPIRSPIL